MDRLEGTATVHGIWGSSPDDLWLIADNSIYYDWYNAQWVYTIRKSDSRCMGGGAARTSRGPGRQSGELRIPRNLGHLGERHLDRRRSGNDPALRGQRTEWQVVESPTTETLHAVWGAAPNDAWAVGESGTILHWDGSAWKPALAAFPANKKKPHLYGVWGSGPDDMWIVGDGIALRSTGGAK